MVRKPQTDPIRKDVIARSEATKQSLFLSREAVLPLIIAALKEDVGARDLTSSAIIPKEHQAKGDLIVRQEGIVAGLQVAEWVFTQTDSRIRFKPMVPDGSRVFPGKVVAFVEGPARGILAAERTALNFLGHLSGVASLTRLFVEKVKRYRVQILDTRKTTPGLRLLEKYAVAAGGGAPHRMGLYDQVLIKDNHLQLVGGLVEAVQEARTKLQKDSVIEVEVNDLRQFRLALSAQADIVLLDNMKLADIQEAVRLRNAVGRGAPAPRHFLGSKEGAASVARYRPLLEVSGGVTLATVEAIAAAGVDRISIGALTHSAPALNVALELLGP